MIDISVIVPFYGVERFIATCVESLMTQTLRTGVEFIFVDDASPDNSRRILEKVVARYSERKENLKILTHEKNKGLPAARNTGMRVAQGKYVFHMDSDDFLEPTMLETMLSSAKVTQADYVWCDWFLSYENSERLMLQPAAETVSKALKLMLENKLKYNVWNKLIRRSIYSDNNIAFPEGYSMGEDMTMIRLLAKSAKICHVSVPGYHYVRTNTDAMTQSFSLKKLCDLKYNVELTVSFLSKEAPFLDEQVLNEFKLHTKYPFLFSDQTEYLNTWNELWPESNQYISLHLGKRSWLLNIMAKYRMWWFLKLHFRLYTYLYNKAYGKGN